ncbi:hypothetical protein HU200_067699 [Digitaria exilis]|uniref:EF-hand domain-containing protein n=1 Tax=Digitaria exilis TaxID=1010633 RepID=A0A834ZY80_9POAL|nr:hypothetical protein HU200_067699 [Digitaria exilis]
MVAVGQRLPAAASLQLLPVIALVFLWIFTCNWENVEASIDIANMTALQKHVEFFDRNKDGIITASELFEGYVAIGCDVSFSRTMASSISAGVGPITSPADAPLPHLSVYIEYIHKAMHGSDTGALDAEGRSASEGEWGLIYKLASDNEGFLHKDSVKGIYDGKVFYKLEEQRMSSRSDI